MSPLIFVKKNLAKCIREVCKKFAIAQKKNLLSVVFFK